jgi:epoxyqueuosine reductase
MNSKYLGKILFLLAWMGFIFVLLTTEMTPKPDTGEISLYDKVVHFALFAVLSFTYVDADRELRGFRFLPSASLAILLASAYALLGEFLQNFVMGRHSSVLDLVAGMLGALAGVLVFYFIWPRKPKLLLHICCIGCGASVAQELSRDYDLTLYFYNPNIYPQKEHDKRLEEIAKTAKKLGLRVVVEPGYDYADWRLAAVPLADCPEKGQRCRYCIDLRLEKTAAKAAADGFDCFGTTLTVSPHKDAVFISAVGQRLASLHGVGFLDRDFKKKDGFKKAAILSRQLGLYRQDYCGCEFSLRRREMAQNRERVV